MRSNSRNPGEPEPQTAPAAASRAATARPAFELFLISFLILFLELAWIRWLGSVVVFLTFFTNIVLMACFLGVSVGCLASARRFSWMNAFIPLAIVAAASASAFLWIYERTQRGHDRRRLAAVAAGHLLWGRLTAEGFLEVGDPDRALGRLLLHTDCA